MAKKKKSIVETVQEKYPEFTPTVDGLSVQDLEMKLSMYTKENEKVVDAMEEDEELIQTQERLSEMKGPYNDTKKAIRLKQRYIIKLIREKGGDA